MSTARLLKKVLRMLQISILCIVLAELGYYFLLVPYTRISKVFVNTTLPLSEQDILRMAELQGSHLYFSTDTELVEERLSGFFHIRRAEVLKEFPHTLRITLEERKPLAILLDHRVEEGTFPALIDEEGMVFEVGAHVTDLDLPVLSGISFPSLSLGDRVPEDLLSFLTDLHHCKVQYPNTYKNISEYAVMQRDAQYYEVLVYPQQQRTPVRFSLPLDYQRYAEAFTLLQGILPYDDPSQFLELDYRGEVAILKERKNG